MNTNSLSAWAQICNSPKLSRNRRTVAAFIADEPNKTANELFHNSSIKGYWKRYSELERMGVIVRTGSRRCEVSGFTADTWAINPEATSENIKRIKIGKSTMRIEMERVLDACQQGELEYVERLKIISRIAQEALK